MVGGKKKNKKEKKNPAVSVGPSSKPKQKAGFTQHPGAMAAAGQLERKNYFRIRQSSRAGYGAVCIEGQDYLGQVSITNNQPAGTNFFNSLIGPAAASFLGTRLAQFAELYDKYYFKKFRIHWQSACPSSVKGSLVLAYDRDPEDSTPPATDQGIRSLVSYQGARTCKIWEDVSIDCPLADNQDFYYTNDSGYDARLIYQGQVYLSALSPTDSTTVGTGALWMEYEVELFDPQNVNVYHQTKFGGANKTTSNATNAGFNNLDTISVADPVITLNTDSAGNNYVTFPQGTWNIEQIGVTTSAALNPMTLSFLNNIPAAAAVVQRTYEAVNAATGGAGNLFKWSQIDVPPGGTKMYGTWASNGVTLVGLGLRCFGLQAKFSA